MTPEQILGIAETSVQMLQAPAAPPPAAPATPSFDVADDEYITGAQYRQLMAARPVDDSATRLAADANVSIVRSQYAQDFAKYGAEVNALIDRIPVNQRTIDNLALAVRMVRSDHVDEIAAERAQQLAATMTPTLRPTGGGAAAAPVSRDASLESEKIPQEWKDRARAAKLTEENVADFARANGMTTAQFYKQFETPMNMIVQDISARR